jgi:hypothetical protein
MQRAIAETSATAPGEMIKDVEAAEFVKSGVKEPFYLRRLGNVTKVNRTRREGGKSLLCAETGSDDARTRLDETPCSRDTEAACATDEEAAFVGQWFSRACHKGKWEEEKVNPRDEAGVYQRILDL